MEKTENTTAESRDLRGEPPRCRSGIRTPRPCWREATERRWPEDEAPTMCPEHARLSRLVDERDAWQQALEALEGWAKDAADGDPHGRLENIAAKARDDARTHYAAAAARARAAELVAREGPPEEGERRLAPGEAEALVRLLMRADAFSNARTILEDAPDGVLGRVDRWAMVDALASAAEAACEEVERCRRGLGLKSAAERLAEARDV